MTDTAQPSIRPIPVIGAGVIGGLLGWLVATSAIWATAGAVIGIGTATMIIVYGVRPLVAAPVGIGAGVGAYLGGTIVGVLCEPAGCAAFEAAAATTTGIGALVGIGLVVALATRSFDEFRDSQRLETPSAADAGGRDTAAPARHNHAVIAHYRLRDNSETEAFFALEDSLISTIESVGVGEYDGNAVGDGEATIYLYGRDADALFGAVEHQLRDFPSRPAHCVLRYGDVDQPNVRERRIDL